MLMDDGHVVTGIRHYSPEMRETLRRAYGKRRLRLFGIWWIKPYHIHVVEEGFVDTSGKFLSRKDAWVVAEINGQIKPHPSLCPGTLYSEDLY